MSSEPRNDSVWHRLGYALERVRQATVTGEGPEAQSVVRIPSTPPSVRGSVNPFFEVGAGWLERQAVLRVQRWIGTGSRTPWIGAAVGAALELAAATVTGVVRAERHVRDTSPAVEPESGTPILDPPRPAPLVGDPLGVAARGAAHGLIYAGLLSSVPGPAWCKGLGYGVARYFAAEGGGLAHVLGPISPHRAVPLLHPMLADEDRDESWIAHVATGVALALIYESSRASRGTTPGSADDAGG